MRIHTHGSNRWYRWGRIVLAVVILAGLLDFGYRRLESWRDRPSDARRIAEAAAVTGFVRKAVVDIPDSDNPPYAEAIFIGPAPKPDPLTAVSVPTIRLQAVMPEPDPLPWKKTRYYFIVANGQRPDGCKATVAFNTDPQPEDVNSILTAQQIEEVRNGTQILIELVVGDCKQ
jgi:hypothetical protein